ncbi:Hsp70 family protein [Cryptosporangium arvum]|uniref:Molecular chaperone n=1 Tax=Cryptosporangium arvum DSM 44712 TaxID=927661 RepID=A0A010Z5B1_9ACTN|nr:Hsp70 family protein [Cryptosporangium arvum]EXG82533.1 molecular chaperone [Cryptosporangium arvum DSM 44712]
MSTIDYGIDLGTTNSAIAALSGVDTRIVKNNDDQDTTPSAVWVDRRDRVFVGRAARDRAEADPGNTCTEFKLRMGTAGAEKHFAAGGRTMSPEQLSAEVLRSLRADVHQRDGVELDAAVITVPAAFELGACEATRRAAALAGLRTTPLLQEPTAAAYAYGFQSGEDARWLVYDLGGGTFDAAVVQLRDGEFTVLTHRGDPFLGGKLVDWRIVETLLVPAVAAEFGLDDLSRGNPRWTAVLSRLKLAAEAAKIRLSRAPSVDVLLELDLGEPGRHEFEFEVHRADVERLTEPYLIRSVNLCRQALADSRLAPDDLARVLLVGGPTLSPYLREWLADADHGLGVRLDHSQDPITAVARGAAIFAGTQRRPGPAPVPDVPGARLRMAVEYAPIGPDTEPLIAGRLLPAGEDRTPDLVGHRVELISDDPGAVWRSGQYPVGPDGFFAVPAWAERGRRNTYRITVTDPAGTPIDVPHDPITYTVGIVETSPLLTNSIGVGLEGNTRQWLVRRGTPLPAYGRVTLRTAVDVGRGGHGGVLRIPFLEGEHARADRNRQIGRLEVVAAQVSRDLPEGSEVQVRLEIDASRLITARAYVPILDEEFEHVVRLGTETAPAHAVLSAELEVERRRLAAVRQRQRDVASPVAEIDLFRIDDERIEPEVAALVDAARADPDAASAAGRRLLDLRAAVDAVEDALEWPELVSGVEQAIEEVRRLVATDGDAGDRRRLDELSATARRAVDDRDPRLLRVQFSELAEVAVTILDRSGRLDVMVFEDLARRRGELLDRAQGDALLERGRQAVAGGDHATLRNLNVRLRGLLPVPPPPPDPFSTVRRA